MGIAIEEKRIILTFDRDYGELIFKYNFKPVSGVIYLRLDHETPQESGLIVENILSFGYIDSSMALAAIVKRDICQRKF